MDKRGDENTVAWIVSHARGLDLFPSTQMDSCGPQGQDDRGPRGATRMGFRHLRPPSSLADNYRVNAGWPIQVPCVPRLTRCNSANGG